MCRFEGKSILGLRGTDSSGTGLDGAEFFCSPDLCGEQKLPLPGAFPADRKPCTDNVSVAAYLRDSCSRFLFQQSESGIHREEGVQKSCSCDFPYGDAVSSGAGCLVFFRLLAFYTGRVRCPDMAGKSGEKKPLYRRLAGILTCWILLSLLMPEYRLFGGILTGVTAVVLLCREKRGKIRLRLLLVTLCGALLATGA